MNGFRNRWTGPVLSRDEGKRQGLAANAAFAALGIDGARTFLNSHHKGLRGRPLDLAVASDAGLRAVETAICVEARRGVESC